MLGYSSNEILKALEPVFDDHAEWYGNVMRRIFYADQYGLEQGIETPGGFRDWMTMARAAHALEDAILDRVELVHGELHNLADTLIARKLLAKETPDIDAFDNFTTLYDQFILQLRRLERDYTLAQNGIDYMTGLRNVKAMEIDFERELERLARRGHPFCLILARLDFCDDIQKKFGKERTDEIIKVVSGHIKRGLRSFDDAYRQNDCEFVMLLKQTDTIGGAAAIERLRRFFIESPILLNPKDEASRVTMSFCAAAPAPGDILGELLQNMRNDLIRYDEGGDTSLEYYEQSPLQRFLLDGDHEKQA